MCDVNALKIFLSLRVRGGLPKYLREGILHTNVVRGECNKIIAPSATTSSSNPLRVLLPAHPT